MKNYKKTLMGLALFAGIVSFASCSDDAINDGGKTDSTGEVLTPQTNIEVIDSATVSMHDHYTRMLAEVQKDIEGANSEEEVDSADLALKEILTQKLRESDSLDLADAGANGADWGTIYTSVFEAPRAYKYVSIKYQSVDENNNPITLSTLIAYPRFCGTTLQPNNLVIGCHVTISQDAQCPSNYKHHTTWKSDVGMTISHAGNSSTLHDICYHNLVVMPDYEGYGSSANRAHPYLYQTVTARQVVDGVKAGLEWFEKNEMQMKDGWQSMCVGYSQGGSVSMAVHRYIEEHNLVNTFNFKGSICGDGPYDPVATLKDYIKDNKVFMPVAVGMIIKGMCDANPIITKAGYQPKDFFTDKFMASGIIDMIAGKLLNTDDIQKKLAEASLNGTGCTAYLNGKEGGFLIFGGTWAYREYTKANYKKYTWEKPEANGAIYWKTADLIRPEILAYFNGATEGRTAEGDAKGKALEQALEMNNLTTKWTPAHPMVLFHSTKDEVVKYANYESAMAKLANVSQLVKGISYENKKVYLHVSTGSSFLGSYEGTYTRWIFNPDTDWNAIPKYNVEKGNKLF